MVLTLSLKQASPRLLLFDSNMDAKAADAIGHLGIKISDFELPALAPVSIAERRRCPANKQNLHLARCPCRPISRRSSTTRSGIRPCTPRSLGSAAAPTAGLHFTRELLDRIRQKGISEAFVTLHVGLGTFRPVKAEEVTEHHMHSELCMLSQETADLLNATRQRGGRIVCVGTTSCRTLESLVGEDGSFCPGSKWTDIFIYPGYRFRAMDAHHQFPSAGEHADHAGCCPGRPGSTCWPPTREAVRERYRFFSFGDAMFIANEA